MRNISNIKGVLYAVVSSATFGLIPLFSIPLLHAGMASPTILFYRMLLSAAIMAAVALLLKRNFRISRRDFGVLAGLSLMYAATSLGLLRSYDYIPSGVATTVNFLYPLVVTIVMTLFFRERSSVWIVIAVFISLVGVALLAWGDAGNQRSGTRPDLCRDDRIHLCGVYHRGDEEPRRTARPADRGVLRADLLRRGVSGLRPLDVRHRGSPHMAHLAQPAVA